LANELIDRELSVESLRARFGNTSGNSPEPSASTPAP
jgi:hypothetical protein